MELSTRYGQRASILAGDSAAGPDPELKLPKRSSLIIILLSNVLLQMSFFIIVSSSNAYAEHLGGDATFSGVVLGIPTLISGIALLPIMKYDRGGYKLPLHISCGSSILGHVLYALAYRADYLYLILLGRMVSGFAFTMFMYNKRYCSDARFVGVRRRTTLASWLVISQGVGMTAGPFLGGLLFKVGFGGMVWNGYTSPGWLMAVVWAVFWVCVTLWYEDPEHESEPESMPLQDLPPAQPIPEATMTSTTIVPITITTGRTPPTRAPPELAPRTGMSLPQWGVSATMCWFAMTCFFVLGAWEANLPVFGAGTPALHWSPFAAGNFIALGGAGTFPFLLANLFLAPRTQDRKILALGSALGAAGLVVFLGLLRAGGHERAVSYGSLFACWWAVALGFNLASTVTVSLLSKQLPPEWNRRTSLAIQYSIYAGRVTGAVWGGSGVKLGMQSYVGLELAIVGIGAAAFMFLWRDLKAKTG